MSSCSGNPSDCGFCGVSPPSYLAALHPAAPYSHCQSAPAAHDHCAKTEVTGCAANPSSCSVCQGNGCLATECTGNASTCKACSAGQYTSCRRQQLSATEGIDRPAAQ
ncbi:hypothetical protein VHUM_00502 [Vanrija humicola]|uniref:Uncharacterized protein n=1 Tax=Vanrija humicola TaxID=5417 RepID=A0A7D8Z4E0_VANHU|nr:hypothetical protein VHUM_00502 [Vanrija humicola]